MNILNSQLDQVIQKYFSDRQDLLEVWKYIKTHPEFVLEILQDTDKAIILFNSYKSGKFIEEANIPLRSSSYLKQILKQDLPSVSRLIELVKIQDEQTIQTMVDYVKEFDFIETLRPIENCAGTLLLGCYRCAMRAIYPYIKEKDGQVASSLEEMVALMALKGEKTKLFETVRFWYTDYEEEGFSKELSEAVSNI